MVQPLAVTAAVPRSCWGETIGRIYICMSTEGTMYSNWEREPSLIDGIRGNIKKGCPFGMMGKKCDRLVNEARWSIERAQWDAVPRWERRP